MNGQNKIKRGTGFKGVLAYLLDHDEPEFVGGTLPLGSLNQMTREFVALSSTRNDIEKPVWHNSLRLPAGEHIPNDVWQKIATDYMKHLGFDNAAQWIAFKHNKADGEHIHIIANRILPTGNIYLGQNENLKSTAIIADLENKYNLTVTKSVEFNDDNKIIKREKSIMKKNEQEKMNREGQLSERIRLQTIIDKVIMDNPTIEEFVERLNSLGVNAHPNIAKTGRMNGFSFSLKNGELAFSGSKLGRKYTWGNLLQAGLQYDAINDALFLSKLKQKQQQAVSDDEDKANIIMPTQSPTDIVETDDEERQQLECQFEEFYERKNQQYFCIRTGHLAFTEEAERIICHLNDPEAIAAMTKLSKIKFGNEYRVQGTEEFRREAWIQAALLGCLASGYDQTEEDIIELKRRLSGLKSKPDLHEKIADLLTDDGNSSSSTLPANDSKSQLDKIKIAVSEKETTLQALFKQRKTISSQHPVISDEDRTEIKKRAYQSSVPASDRKKLATMRKKVRNLKNKINDSNNLFHKFQLNKQLKHAEVDLTASKQAINTPELIAKQRVELARITQEAEQHYQNMRMRKQLELDRIDEKSDVLLSEIEPLEKQRGDLARLKSNNDASKISKPVI